MTAKEYYYSLKASGDSSDVNINSRIFNRPDLFRFAEAYHKAEMIRNGFIFDERMVYKAMKYDNLD